mmetsp:Transcript_27905/g.43130  ORF Transcript_27905/g.43130 Transcript_27905/m.43130 type:complete len:210 (+) Transcript_27905:14-643(+)
MKQDKHTYNMATNRQTTGSYVNAVVAIAMYGWLTNLAWSKSEQYVGRFLAAILSIVFGLSCLLQIFGLIAEFMDIEAQPRTGDNQRIAALHAAVLGAFYKRNKGGVIISCGDNFMLAIEFDGPLQNGGLYGEMAFVDRDRIARAVVRQRNCRRATELGIHFLDGEAIHYIDCNESDFFHLLSKYKMQARYTGQIDVKSGLNLYSVRISR